MAPVSQRSPGAYHRAHRSVLTVFFVAYRAASFVPWVTVERNALVLATRFAKLGQAYPAPCHAPLRGVARIRGARIAGRATAEFHVVDGHSCAGGEAAGRESEAQFPAHGDVVGRAIAGQRGYLAAIPLRTRVLALETVAGIALHVKVGLVGDDLIVYRARIEFHVIQRFALVQTVGRALADLMGALVETRNLHPRSYGDQLLGHFPQKASWHAAVRLSAVMEQLTDFALGAWIDLARGRDILLHACHGLVVLRIVEERFQRHAWRV